MDFLHSVSFKPCYKWNTFNTERLCEYEESLKDSFKPCYKWNTFNTKGGERMSFKVVIEGFKPCYKWNTFNTESAVYDRNISG